MSKKGGAIELRQLFNLISDIAAGNNPSLVSDEFAFSEYYRGYEHGRLQDTVTDRKYLEYHASAQDGKHILIRSESGDEEFWNIVESSEENAENEKRKRMREKLIERFKSAFEDPSSKVPPEGKSGKEAVKQRLRDLGYI